MADGHGAPSAEALKDCLESAWQWCIKHERDSRDGMNELEVGTVKKRPIQALLNDAVKFVTDDTMAQVSKVNSNLMSPTRLEAGSNQGRRSR
jgi:hypothetical protein